MQSQHSRSVGVFVVLCRSGDDCLDLLRAITAESPDTACVVVPTCPSQSVGALCASAPWLLASLQLAEPSVALRRGGLYLVPDAQPLGFDGIRFTTARESAMSSLDALLSGLARHQAPSTVLVQLEGLSPPSLSLVRALREGGGLSVAAQSDGSRSSPELLPTVDLLLPSSAIAFEVASLARHLEARPSIDAERDARLERIASLVSKHVGRDIHGFCREKLARRVERRMWLHRLPAAALYLDTLQTDANEARALYADLLTRVTEFFCDPDTFDTLRATVVPDLIERAGPEGIRVWVPGCSTGEEAFSLAMLLTECIEAAGSPCKFHVFATDVDPTALSTARSALYPEAVTRTLSPARLARFFELEQDGYRVRPELQRAVTVAEHDLLRDAPLEKIQLISCRNVLCAVTPETRAELVSVLHFALDSGGFLVLGGPGELAKTSGLFRAMSACSHIYEPREVPRRPPALGRSRAERLVSLGASAADMAHELKNPLGSIALSAEYARATRDPERIGKLLDSISRNAERCGRIVENVLRFARDEPTERAWTDIHAVVGRAIEVACSHHGPERLQVAVDLPKPSPRVRCNVTELEQVVVNLLRNAVEAHPACCRVAVRSEVSGASVTLRVSDDGPGVPATARDKIFHPFFSTKRSAGGSGLGLSISARIVSAHGGNIRLLNDGRPGATFELEFPCERPATEEEADHGAHSGS